VIVTIDDPADPRLADFRLLHGAAALRTRADDAHFVAEGWVAIARTLDSGHAVRSLLLLPARVARLRQEFPDVADSEVPVYVAEREVLEGSVGFDVHRGVLAAAERKPPPTIDDLASAATRLAVLEGLNDAENVGVIARAARALGVHGMVLDPTCTDPYARRTVRVSMGEVLHLPVARASEWPGTLDRLAQHGFEIWALTPGAGASDIWSTRVPNRLALVFGAEGPGLSDAVMERATRLVRIPIAEDVDSLNVGHAAAVAFAVTGRPE